MNRLGRGTAAAACVAALATAATGCGSAAPSRPASTPVTAAAVPLATATVTAAGTWAAVVMGGSQAQHNNFWQLFIRPAGSSRWKLVTPPGTADNGGLVLAGSTGQNMITAVRPSLYLHYTPLTQTPDSGHAWSGLNPLDAPLASAPGSLAIQPASGRLLALTAAGTAEQRTPDGTTWSVLVTARALAATPAGRTCGLRALSAVAYTRAGTPLLAGTCSQPGHVGIFASSTGHAWQAEGPVLHGAPANEPITVLRISSSGKRISALLAAGTGAHTTLASASSADDGGSWTISPFLRTGDHAITATSLGPASTAAVITAGGQGAELTRGHWRALPALPRATAALAPAADGTIDALTVHRSTLTVWHLAGTPGRWAKEQILTVPIQYGSSG